MAKKLTAAQERILRNPPTESTWECGRKFDKLADDPCPGVNSGTADRCWMCRKKRPSKPKLLWPLYVAACKKAGIEPGTRWPVTAVTPEAAKRPTKRKGR